MLRKKIFASIFNRTLILAIGITTLLSSGAVNAQIVDPSTITATASGPVYLSNFNLLGTNANNVVNGAGLDVANPTGLHSTSNFNSKILLHGNEIEVDLQLLIDLDSNYDLNNIYFWNYSSGSVTGGFQFRGIETVDFEGSVDGITFFSLYDDFQFEQAFEGEPHAAKEYPFSASNVRYIRMSNFVTFNTADGNGGFAEIQFGIAPVFEVPFAAFDIKKAKVQLDKKDRPKDEFEVKGSFELGAESDGIDPLNEDVLVAFDGYAETISAGSFFTDDDDDEDGIVYKYKAAKGAITKITIRPDGRFEVKAKGLELNSLALTYPETDVDFLLQIGDDQAETFIPFKVDKKERKGKFSLPDNDDDGDDSDDDGDSDDDNDDDDGDSDDD